MPRLVLLNSHKLRRKKMAVKKITPRQVLNFQLPAECRQAIQEAAAGRKVRLSGEVRNGKLTINEVTFTKGTESQVSSSKAFTALNAPFISKAKLTA
jgi:hypothetical protein